MSSPLAPAPQLFHLIPRHFVNVPSRPLWYTVDQTPVLILGGIPEEKAILLTDTNFKDFFLGPLPNFLFVMGCLFSWRIDCSVFFWVHKNNL